MSESEMLKPCPFCGGEATRTTMRKFKYVSCENSDCSMVVEAGALFSREEEAITAWNTRAPTKADLHQAIDAGILEAATNAAYERGRAEERARYDALKAVADKMAVAVRSVRVDAVVENGYEGDGYDYEFPVHIIDSDYVNALYQALADYERATDPAPKLTIVNQTE